METGREEGVGGGDGDEQGVTFSLVDEDPAKRGGMGHVNDQRPDDRECEKQEGEVERVPPVRFHRSRGTAPISFRWCKPRKETFSTAA